mmetsp:Transcript_42908/g.128199  ORF Transcript_42908/g.128199 Transcript_42908/m.128199 type:complete len:209 (-) Transcript_42908:195-821(-)
MPPTSMCLQMSSACSGCRLRPSKDRTCSQKACSEMRSSPCTSSANNPSLVRPLVRTSSRSAVETLPYRASTMDWQAFWTESITAVHFFCIPAAFSSIFCNSRLMSTKGPLTAFPTFASCSSRSVRAAEIRLVSAAARPSASCRSEAGVANSSRSAPFRDVSGATASSSFFADSSMASVLAVISVWMADAAFLSRISMCASLSSCSLLG